MIDDMNVGILIKDLPPKNPSPDGLIEIEYSNLSTHISIEMLSLYLLPPGTLIISAALHVPDGWLVCEGQAIPRTKYARLFQTIGETFGEGDGSTTFQLPKALRKYLIGTGAKLLIRY